MGARRPRNLFAVPDFPTTARFTPAYKRPTGELYGRHFRALPTTNPLSGTINPLRPIYGWRTGSRSGYVPSMSHVHWWHRDMREAPGGKYGYNSPPRNDAFATPETLYNRANTTGELKGPAGEMWPHQIMQTWFLKRTQIKHVLTWSQATNQVRIFPKVVWNDAAMPETFYSELLDHQVRPKMEANAMRLMESYGGIDQWVLQNDPMFLTSWEMEELRNVLLVRRMELEKNFVMDRQATKLAAWLLEKIRAKHARENPSFNPTDAPKAVPATAE